MSEDEEACESGGGGLIDVGRWMKAIRRRARVVVIAEQLNELEEELGRMVVSPETRERVRAMRELVREL